MIRKIIVYIAESYASWALKAHAKSIGGTEYNILGLKIMCQLRRHELVKASLEMIRDYDETIWEDLKNTIDLIIIAKGEGESGEILTRRLVIVFDEDRSHMSTSTHFAGWILQHYKVIQGAKKEGILKFSRSMSNDEGRSLRQEFLAPKLTT